MPERASRGALLLIAASLFAACGDPLIVLGDWPGMMRIVAGIPEEEGISRDSLATATRMNRPRGLAVHANGMVFIADHRNARILGVRSSGHLEVLVDHFGCTTQPCLARPDGIAWDGQDALIVADPSGHRLWRLSLSDGSFTVIAGTGQQGASPDGSAEGAPLAMPSDVAVGPDGRIFFSERAAHRVRALDADGMLTTVAGLGIAGDDGDNVPAVTARLRNPVGLAVHGSTLYIADTGNHRVRAVNLESGTIRVVAGSNRAAFDGDGGPARSAALNAPLAVTVTADGRSLLIGDTQNHRIRRVDLTTGQIHTFAGTGMPDYTGNEQSASETGLRFPGGVAASPQNLFFVSDDNHVVWRTVLGL